MDLGNFALVVAIGLGVVYLGLAVAAYQHVKPEVRSSDASRLLAFTLWWPFYDFYFESGRRFRKAGIVVLVMSALAYAAWFASAR